jgi:hypothetical protein
VARLCALEETVRSRGQRDRSVFLVLHLLKREEPCESLERLKLGSHSACFRVLCLHTC